MKTLKVPEAFVRTSKISDILAPIAQRLTLLQGIRNAFYKCIVLSGASGSPILDPFQLSNVLKATQADAVVALPSAGAIYDSLRDWAGAEELKALATFETTLRAICDKEGYRLEGRYPTYIIDGFLQIRVREGDKATEVGHRSVASLLPDSLVPAIKEAVANERARKFDRRQFIDRLFQAYSRCVLLQQGTLGDPVPVRKVYQEMVMLQQPESFLKSAKKSLFCEYTTEYFARDLAKVLSAGSCQTNCGRWLSDRPTAFPHEGIPISQGGQARIIGKLVFSATRE